MTRNEIAAYNAGVAAVLQLATESAAAIEPMMTVKPTRYNFASGALLALAEEGLALLKELPEPSSSTVSQPS